MKKLNQIWGQNFPLFRAAWPTSPQASLRPPALTRGRWASSPPAGWDEADLLRKRSASQDLTDKPFGVNLMLMNPCADEMAQIIIGGGRSGGDYRARAVPAQYIPAWKEAGIKVLPVVAASILAKRPGESGSRRHHRRGHGVRRPCG